MAIDFHSFALNDTLSARTTTALRVVVALSLAAACITVAAETSEVDADASAMPVIDLSDPDILQFERIFWICADATRTQGTTGVEMKCSADDAAWDAAVGDVPATSTLPVQPDDFDAAYASPDDALTSHVTIQADEIPMP